MTPLGASVVAGFLSKIPSLGGFLSRFLGPYYPLLTSLIALVLAPIAMAALSGLVKWFIRKKVMELVAVEAGWQALQDYFLTINPYFNYAFSLGRNYFLVLDTGHDCLRAQYLWDDGDKKLGPLSIRDNIIGGSTGYHGLLRHQRVLSLQPDYLDGPADAVDHPEGRRRRSPNTNFHRPPRSPHKPLAEG